MIGYDTVSKTFWCPDDAEFAVCYGDGLYENEKACHARFPRLSVEGKVVDLTVRSALWKDPLSGSDIEPGNAGPSTAVGYVLGEHKLGVLRPKLYADLSDMRVVLQNLANANIRVGPPGPARPVTIFTAHPTGHEHLCGPTTCGFPVAADITQFWWSSIQGRWRGFPGDLDVSTARLDAFTPTIRTNPWLIFPHQPRFWFFVNGREVHWDEKAVMVRVDGALALPRYKEYLKTQLRPVAKFLRDRIWRIAKYEPPDYTRLRERAIWADHRHLGIRWQLINHRIQKIDAL